MFYEIVIICSMIAGFVILHYIRSFDFYEPEPYWAMLIATCLGGAWSVGISIYLYGKVDAWGLHNLENAAGAFFVIAPIEELAKTCGFLVAYPIIRKYVNEPIDGIIYIACVALGFSLVENYLYIVNSSEIMKVVSARLFLSTPMHISFSVLIGLAVYCLIEYQVGWRFLAIAFSYACITHGLFDLIGFNDYIAIAVIVLALLAHYWTLSLLGFTSAISPYRKSLKQIVNLYPNPGLEPGLECLQCGDKHPKRSYTSSSWKIQKCSQCGRYACSKQVLFKLFYQFGARFNRLTSQVIEHDGDRKGLATLCAGNIYSAEKSLASFSLEELDRVLEISRKNTIAKLLGRFPHLFGAFRINEKLD